jgi:hypothetical protein
MTPSLAMFKKLKNKGEFEHLAFSFAASIIDYFQASSGLVETDLPTQVSSFARLLEYVDASIVIEEEGENVVRVLRIEAQRLLRSLEEKWKLVSERYGTLNLFCEEI